MSHTTQIPEKLRKLRELKGLSQEYMAHKMDISQRQYQRFESGDADIQLSKLESVCEILEVSLEQLLGFDEQFIFNNCSHNTNVVGGKEIEVNVHFSKDMVKVFSDRIAHLEEEIVYLRNMLKGKL
jgi:transcriptional regulator with XRE-family HTH domain